ncbi:signal peptidase I [Nocardioides sediminis]|uniref:signal peptidase I n=1 Tax=Nocardioides sediminis TaxID=433648 RepID=UPI00131EEA23|nr:signal peptidase I [Nocardioides sediminis]
MTARARRRVAVLAVLAGVVVLVRTTLVVPVRIESVSMLPTLAAEDVVLTTRTPPRVTDLDRGDLVVFRSPEDGRRTIKRVVGVPLDVVVILDGLLHVNGRPVVEPYADASLLPGYYSRTVTVPDEHVFVLGDNRGNSVDSRDYGPVGVDDLTGRVLLRVWPPGTRTPPDGPDRDGPG